MKDPIVEEVRRARRERSARFNHDIDAMFEDLRRSEELSKARGVKFVTPKPRSRQRPMRKTSSGKLRTKGTTAELDG